MNPILEESRRHLADLIEACQRCAWHLEATASASRVAADGQVARAAANGPALFEPLAAMNERFAKLQDLLSTAMRHYCELSGERTDTFLRVLAACEKAGIVPAAEDWQTCRSLRNRAAHDYGTDFEVTASHFNALRGQVPLLKRVTLALADKAKQTLGIEPPDARFSAALRHSEQR